MSIFSGVDARWKNVEEILLLHFKLVFPQGSVRCWLRECSMPVFHFLYFFFFFFFFLLPDMISVLRYTLGCIYRIHCVVRMEIYFGLYKHPWSRHSEGEAFPQRKVIGLIACSSSIKFLTFPTSLCKEDYWRQEI